MDAFEGDRQPLLSTSLSFDAKAGANLFRKFGKGVGKSRRFNVQHGRHAKESIHLQVRNHSISLCREQRPASSQLSSWLYPHRVPRTGAPGTP